MRIRIFLAAVIATVLVTADPRAQVTKPAIPGVTNFARLDSTIACGGATTPAGVAELKKLGYATIINLRQPTENGADVEGEAAAAKEAGVKYIHLPLNGATPDPAVVDRFLKVVVEPANQPVFIHCASGNRAAAVWMIKRLVVDGWDAERAGTEAAALGLTNATLKQFAIDYAAARRARSVLRRQDSQALPTRTPASR
jgi:uncharacterized protein (TIGR01244 family)